MTVNNIKIHQDIISNNDVSINAHINNEIVSVAIDDVENYTHCLIRHAVLNVGRECCDDEETYNKLLALSTENPVNFSDPV